MHGPNVGRRLEGQPARLGAAFPLTSRKSCRAKEPKNRLKTTQATCRVKNRERDRDTADARSERRQAIGRPARSAWRCPPAYEPEIVPSKRAKKQAENYPSHLSGKRQGEDRDTADARSERRQAIGRPAPMSRPDTDENALASMDVDAMRIRLKALRTKQLHTATACGPFVFRKQPGGMLTPRTRGCGNAERDASGAARWEREWITGWPACMLAPADCQEK